MKTYPLSRSTAVSRVSGLVLPVGLVGGPVGGVVEGAEQVDAARLELELGRAASPSNTYVDGALKHARESQIAAEVERALRAARVGARGGAACRGDF